MNEITTLILASLFAVVGYFGRHWVEKRGADQALARKKQVLDIHQKMREQQLSAAELETIEAVLTNRIKHSEELKSEPTPLERSFKDQVANHRLTQIEMNALAADKLIEANGDLNILLSRLRNKVDSDRYTQISEAQEDWERSCENTASFVASKFKGGSILPYIYLIERERLVRERTAQLSRILDEEDQV